MNTLEQLTKKWVSHLEVKNYASSSIASHRNRIATFVTWCHERSLDKVGHITKPVIDRYQRWLFNYRNAKDQPLTFHSQRASLHTIRAFFKWLARSNHILYNPASELELPKVPKRIPRNVLTPDEVKRIINQIDVKTPLGLRDRAMIETFYSCGIRRTELINLSIYDIDFEAGTVFIREGKNKKDRLIPLGDTAIKWVRKYLADVRPLLAQQPDNLNLFITKKGSPFLGTNISNLVRTYCDAAEITKKGSCHMFRHSMATLMLENGADIRFIQAIL